ncbi:class F sortase [Streptosporangium sp. NPDC000396]|uniref:class F sortase n=1 Tax=Streptosporangium sp. NPDC000396 TaxID=3366185 RepID=UPI00369B71D6
MLLGLALVAAGCGIAAPGEKGSPGALRAGASPARAGAGGSGRPTPLAQELGRGEPTRIMIPSIGVNAPLVVLGLRGDGTLAVPPLDHADFAGWYGGGPTPGEPGSAVIVGHLDTRSGPAVFARLGELKAGDPIFVARGDGTVAVFAVERLEQAPKDHFPADRVYGSTRERRLSLVTCGGTFDQVRRSYEDNVIVHALYRAGYLAADLRYPG